MNLTAKEQNNFDTMILKSESYFNPKRNEVDKEDLSKIADKNREKI